MAETSLSERISWAQENLQRQLDWIERHDARSATILSIGVAMLGFLAVECPDLQKLDVGNVFFSLIAVISLTASLAAIYFSQYPRTSSPNNSLVYFGTISILTRQQFSETFCSRGEQEHFNDLCDQTHINASIISKKFGAMKVALIFLLLSAPSWTIALVLFRLNRAI